MRDYFAARYSPANIVLAFAGKGDWDQLVDLADRHCGSWKGGGAPAMRPAARHGLVPDDPPRRGPAADRHRRRRRPAAGERRPLRRAAPGHVLGDHTGSRLYWDLIDPGHADGAEVSYQDYNQAGAFYTFLSCEPDEAQANLAPARRGLPREVLAGITDDELTQAKNKVLSRSVLRGERPMGRLTSLGFHWTYRREYLPVAEELDAFSRVTLDDLRRVLDRVAAPAHDHRLGRPDRRPPSRRFDPPYSDGPASDAHRQPAPLVDRAGRPPWATPRTSSA